MVHEVRSPPVASRLGVGVATAADSTESSDDDSNSGDAGLVCSVCGNSYASAHLLQSHRQLRNHFAAPAEPPPPNAEPRQWRCCDCGKMYQSEELLDAHKKLRHQRKDHHGGGAGDDDDDLLAPPPPPPPSQLYRCDVCSKEYESEHLLLSHQKLRNHGGEQQQSSQRDDRQPKQQPLHCNKCDITLDVGESFCYKCESWLHANGDDSGSDDGGVSGGGDSARHTKFCRKCQEALAPEMEAFCSACKSWQL